MDGTERITVRLPADTHTLLKRMVDSGQYSDMSELINDAISYFLKAHLSPEDMRDILEQEPEDDGSLDDFVSSQDDVDDAIKDAVRSYLNRHIR